MATLELAITGERAASATLLAELRAIPRVDGQRGRRTVAVQSGHTTTIYDLEPGHWVVEVRDPIVGAFSQDVELGQGSTRLEVPLVPPPAPRPQLPFQRPTISYDPPALKISSGFRTSRGLSRVTVSRALKKPRPSAFFVRVQVMGDFSTDLWRSIGIDAVIDAEIAELIRPAPLLQLQGGKWSLDTSKLPSKPGSEWFLEVQDARNRLLLAVPTPWAAKEAVPVYVELEMRSDRIEPHIRIERPSGAGIVDYLAAGALETGAKLFKADERLYAESLYYKLKSPLQACAAAYALVGSADLSVDQEWYPWVENLANWFDIADGRIILARLRLMRASDQSESVAAATEVRSALAMGLPRYTLGLKWLREMIAHFADDPGIAAYREDVDRLASLADISSPFLCLRSVS